MSILSSLRPLPRFWGQLWIVVILVAGLMIFGWGFSGEGETAENQGGKPGFKVERVTGNYEVEPGGNAGLFLAGSGVVDEPSEVESGGSIFVDEVAGFADTKTLQRELDSLRRENFRLKERLGGVRGAGERNRVQTASYSSGESEIHVEELEEEIDSLLSEKEQLEAELDEILGIATLLQEEVEKLDGERRGLSAEELLLLQGEIDRLRRDNGKLEDRIEELGGTIEYLEAKLSDMAPEGIAVIAPSEATWAIAEQIRKSLGQEEIPPKQAERVLVVVFSGLDNPLSYSYHLYGELDQDADDQMDIKASMFHAYIYQINDDLSVHQVEHSTGYN